ncbi:MAG: flagellar hook-associated protein FlgL [Desulfobacterium sp.]|nr:flagellar hook-associated protein FlgL [Desulfobacterium sp.]
MRAPNLSNYTTATYRLGNLTSNLQDANRVVSTQKRINFLSDDPIGMSQVLGMRTNLKGIEQFNKNIEMGKTWLDGGEAALKSINEDLDDLRTRTQYMGSEAANKDQRAAMVAHVDNVIKQMMAYGNTQVVGNYIFSGTKTSEVPFTFDDDLNPTKVVYNGDANPFAVKTSESFDLEVGRNGEKIFSEESITIDSSNNKIDFREFSPEYYQNSKELTAEIADGTYTKDELAEAIEIAMDHASTSKEGYGLAYDVKFDAGSGKFSIQDDGSKKGAHVELLFGSGTHSGLSTDSVESDVAVTNLNVTEDNNTFQFRENTGAGLGSPLTVVIPAREYGSGEELAQRVQYEMNQVSSSEYEVSYNELTNKFSIRTGSGSDIQGFQVNWTSEPNLNTAGSALGFNKDDFYPLHGDLSHGVGTSIAADIGFDTVDVRDAIVGDSKVAAPITIAGGVNDEIRFYEDSGDGYGLQGPITATLPPGGPYSETGLSPISYDDLANEIEAAMEKGSEDYYPDASGGIDYEVSFDHDKKVFVIQEEGSPQLKEIQIDWNGSGAAKALGEDLGFAPETDVHTPPTSDTEPEWGIFNTLFDLKGYLASNDVEGLNRTLTRLDSHMAHVESFLTNTGLKQNNLQVRVNVMAEAELSVNNRRSSIEDADIVKSAMDLKAIQTAYEAALSSTSKIMKISLVDYM